MVSKREILFDNDELNIPIITQLNPSICDPVQCISNKENIPATNHSWPHDPGTIYPGPYPLEPSTWKALCRC